MCLLRGSQERYNGRMPENAHIFDRGAREAILGVSEGIILHRKLQNNGPRSGPLSFGG